MGLFGPKKSKFEASVQRDNKGRIIRIDSVSLSPKEIKKLAELEKRKTEGEKGYKALAAGVKDVMKGHTDSKHSNYGRQIMQDAQAAAHAIKKVDPSKIRQPSDFAIKNPKLQPIKDQMHPAAYRALLHREAKRQGLI